MWLKNIFRRPNSSSDSAPEAWGPLFDEAFLRRMERLSLQAQRTLRGQPIRGEHPSHHHIPSSVFSDHRPYTRGDDLRYIDWNIYASHDHLVLKLGETEQDVDIHLLLDASRSMAWGAPPKLRIAQQLVGTLGYLALARSDRVYVTPFGATRLAPFGPTRGKTRLIEMLRYIEEVSLQEQTSLTTMVQQHARSHPRGGMLILCSDMLVDEGLDEGLRLLRPPRWQVLILHIIDPRELKPELQPGLHGPLELYDSESHQQLSLVVNDSLLEEYRQSLFAWQERLAAACAHHGATYARIMTDWPLERKIIPFLRKRQFIA